ncbi:hypothetical protein EBI_25946, partial [Enterocytozoon bieneusi H348]
VGGTTTPEVNANIPTNPDCYRQQVTWSNRNEHQQFNEDIPCANMPNDKRRMPKVPLVGKDRRTE